MTIILTINGRLSFGRASMFYSSCVMVARWVVELYLHMMRERYKSRGKEFEYWLTNIYFNTRS